MAGEVDGFWVAGLEGTEARMNACLTIIGTAAEIAALSASTYKRCLAYATDTGRFYYSTGSAWTLMGIGTHTHVSAGAQGGALHGDIFDADIGINPAADHARLWFKLNGVDKMVLMYNTAGALQVFDTDTGGADVLRFQIDKNTGVVTLFGPLVTASTLDGIDLSAHVVAKSGVHGAGALDLAISNSGAYSGNDVVNRAIPHGLGRVPKMVMIVCSGSNYHFTILTGLARVVCVGADNSNLIVTAMDATNFYVGNATNYLLSANGPDNFYWVAIG